MKKLLSIFKLQSRNPYEGLPDATPKGIARTVKPKVKARFNTVFQNANKQFLFKD